MEEETRVIPNFILYASDFKVIKDKLTNKDIVMLLDAISDLCLYGETDYAPSSKFSSSWFTKLKRDFENNSKRYISSVKNGCKGGRPKKNPQVNPQVNPTETDGETIKENKIKENKIKENKIYIEVLNYLNQKANKNFKPVNSNLKYIQARLNEGFTKDDLLLVVDTKVAEWKNKDDMKKYLQPSTLFGGKCDNYLQQANNKVIPIKDEFTMPEGYDWRAN